MAMGISLFNNESEKTYFYNLLAARKLRNQIKEREYFEEEIENALNTCAEILKEYGARSNFIADIDELERTVENNSTLSSASKKDMINIEEKIASLTVELTQFLKTIPREVSEELEFYSKQIVDRRIRRETSLANESNVIELYPEANSIDMTNVFEALTNFFKNIRSLTGEEELEITNQDNINEVIDLETNRQKVVGIKKAPRALLKNANLIEEDYSEELSKPITKTNTGLFGIIDDVFTEVNTSSITPEPAPIIKEELKPIEIISEKELNSPVSKIETEAIQEIVPESNVIPFEKEEVTTKTNEEETLKFEMPPSLSLTDLAKVIGEDNYDWQVVYDAIYRTNKELLDKVVAERNNGNFEGIENDSQLFSGETLNIPSPTEFVSLREEIPFTKAA